MYVQAHELMIVAFCLGVLSGTQVTLIWQSVSRIAERIDRRPRP